MTILTTDIVGRPSILVSDVTASANGGMMNFNSLVTSGAKNNLFPDVTQSQRTAGVTIWRKMFYHVQPSTLSTLINAYTFMDQTTPGDDYCLIFPGTQRDTQSTRSSRAYGIGTLASGISAAATTATLTVENIATYTSATPFQVNDLVRIANMAPGGSSGTEEFVTLTAVTYNSGNVAITFTPAVANAYVSGSTVSSLIVNAAVTPTVDSVNVTSSAGVFDYTQITMNNKYTPEQAWTLTFSSSTAYTITCDTLGITQTGNTSSTSTIASGGNTLLTIASTAFSGTYASGNTVTFATHPSAIPVWLERIVPAGAGTTGNDYISLSIEGASS
jgi:hypothetical protein